MTGVSLDVTKIFCRRHLEPLRDLWPVGVGSAAALIFDAFAADARVLEMAPKDADGLAQVGSMGALVSECSPLCCFLGEEIAGEVVREALSGGGPRLDALAGRRRVLEAGTAREGWQGESSRMDPPDGWV